MNFPCSIFYARDHPSLGVTRLLLVSVTRRVRLAKRSFEKWNMSYPNYPPAGGGYPPQTVRFCNDITKRVRYVLENRAIHRLEALIRLVVEVVIHRLPEGPSHHQAATQEAPLQLQDSVYHQGLTKHVRRIILFVLICN